MSQASAARRGPRRPPTGRAVRAAGDRGPRSHARQRSSTPGSTPDTARRSRSGGPAATPATGTAASVPAPPPSASASARRSTSCTSDCSRNRTSALVGCTLTSTRSGGDLDEQVHLGTALLDRRHAVGGRDGVRDRLVPDDAAVDEHVLGPAHRPLLAERARRSPASRKPAALPMHLDEVRRGRRTAGRSGRARRPPAALQHACVRRWSGRIPPRDSRAPAA